MTPKLKLALSPDCGWINEDAKAKFETERNRYVGGLEEGTRHCYTPSMIASRDPDQWRGREDTRDHYQDGALNLSTTPQKKNCQFVRYVALSTRHTEEDED